MASGQTGDWVRLEIAAALRHHKTAVPRLVGGAKMPLSRELPSEISEITLRHGVTLAQGHFRRDTEELIDMLTSWRGNAAG